MRIKLIPIKVPKKHMNSAAMEKAVGNALRGLAASIKTDFDTTTQTWENRSKFEITEPKPLEIVVGTTDPVYGYLDWGTRKNYPIRPKKPGGMLVFQTGYNAKTKVGVIGSQEGGKFGPTTARKEVTHPGIDARNFSRNIADKWRKLSPRTIQRAIDSLT